MTAYAFITVPALGNFPPVLRRDAPELTVASGDQLVIPLDEHVQVAPGRTPSIADASGVTATRSDGSALVRDARTLQFTSADGYAGPASITVPVAKGPQEYLKVGPRNAMVISVAGLAAVVDLEARAVAVGLGSVGPVPLRAPEAEAWVVDRIDWSTAHLTDPDDAVEFGRLVAGAARPIDDHRATADYRRHCVSVLARRALTRMFAA